MRAVRDPARRVGVLALCLMAFAGAAVACSTSPSDERYTQTTLPDQASFQPVSVLLDVRCGSLDCHGNVARNLCLYGSAGQRLSASDRPLVPACNTTDEIEQDYVSTVGLEPEQMQNVARGADPATLTMMRKARGTEAHKGEQIWSIGDDSDLCMTSWLAGKADPASCARAVAAALPDASKNPLVQCIAP